MQIKIEINIFFLLLLPTFIHLVDTKDISQAREENDYLLDVSILFFLHSNEIVCKYFS